MTTAKPLTVFDTNILVDVWLGRDGDQAVLLLELAEAGRIELVLPEYALIEFRGTALRWLRDEGDRLNRQVRSASNEWQRCTPLGDGADQIRAGAACIERRLSELRDKVAGVDERIRRGLAWNPTRSMSISAATCATSRARPRIGLSVG